MKNPQLYPQKVNLYHNTKKNIRVELGWNNMDLCDISPIASDILWYQLIPHC